MIYLPNDRGQGLVEYGLILALVAIVIIVALALLGPQIGNVFSRTTTPPERAHVLLLETVGQLYKELGAWRKHLAVLAFKGGMSQRAVADAVQVSRRTIQVWIEETDREMARMQTPQDQSCMPDGYDDVEAA